MALHKMLHVQDPKKEIMDKFADVLANVDLFHNQVLVATYMRPNKTAGGIILTDKTTTEDKYQGKVGLVLKKGPAAFKDDERFKFYGVDVEVGDWVFYRAADGQQMALNGEHVRILEDTRVRGKVKQPDMVL